MGKHKKTKLMPQLSEKEKNDDQRFIMVGNSLLLSKRFQALGRSAQSTYLCLCMEAGKGDRTKFSHSAAKKYGIASTTFDRAIKELITAGFVELIEDENRSQFKTNIFRFSNRWKLNPAPRSGEGKKKQLPHFGEG